MKSIKTKGMIFAFCLLMCAIFALGITSYYRFRYILIQEVNHSILNIAQVSSDHLSKYMDQLISPLVGISENEDIKSMDFHKQKIVLSSQINPAYLNVAIVNMNGVAKDNEGATFDLSDREYIQETLAGNISFSEVIISRKTNTPVIMVGVPIYRDEVIVGALIARLDVDFLQNSAFIGGYGEAGEAYVISDQGTFMYRPDKGVSTEEYNLFQIAGQDESYISLAEFVQANQSKQAGVGKYVSEGKHYFMGYASVDKTKWKIYFAASENQVLERLYGIRNTIILVMAIVIVFSVIVAAIYVNRESKSIIELDHLFEEGAKGNLTIRFIPKSNDEIGRVGRNFNRMMDKIKTLMYYDPLTKLLNQYVLEKDIDIIVKSDSLMNFSLIMVAIDKFSFINDNYGYNVGDAILFEVSRRITSSVESHYQVYRYKGDEFVVLCKEKLSENDIYLISQNLLAKLKESYYYDEKTIEVNISIGIFHRNEEVLTEEPIKAVTMAKNCAKHLGSNQIQKFEPHMYTKLKGRSELQADILSGIKQNQFFLVYQPLFNLENEQIAEAEVLIRWKHPKKGLLYPDQFIEIAEVAGTIVNIDHWVIESACKQLYYWRLNNKQPIMLSINISAKTFETKKFVPNFVDILNKYDVDPHLIQLEITERMVIQNVEESILKLKALRKMGIHIAIDDFGIGYSSLSYMVRLPIDCIKIDKSFVQNMAISEEAKSIVTTIINLCKTLNLNVVAEGIESRMELEYLRANNCDVGQGYYFSKPVEILEVEEKYMNTEMVLSDEMVI